MTTWIKIQLALERSWVLHYEVAFLENQCVREEIEKKIGKYFEFSKNKALTL